MAQLQHSWCLEVMNTFANWVATNQKMTAKVRVNDDLNRLCSNKFQIQINNDTLANWDKICIPWLCELAEIENELGDDENRNLELYKKNIFCKYFGTDFANEYGFMFSWHHDAYQMRERVRHFLSLRNAC